MSSSGVQSGHWHPASRPDSGRESRTSSANAIDPPDSEEASGFVVDSAPKYETGPSVGEGGVKQDAPIAMNEPMETIPPPSAAPLTAPYSPSKGAYNGGEMPDDEDDERFDPAWGFSRTNTEHFLSSANRSTTFPSFVSPNPDWESVLSQNEDAIMGHPDSENLF